MDLLQNIEELNIDIDDNILSDFLETGYVVLKQSFSPKLVQSMKMRLNNLELSIDKAPSPFKTTLPGSASN
jgi:hypothetical protein